MTASHKTECMSYARLRAEDERPIAGNPEVEILALELLSIGDVSCICHEIPA